jgi:hypothetical protein
VADPLHDDGVPIHSAGAWVSGPSGESLRVAQEKSKWCWAAAMQMLLRHVGLPEKRQCEIAGKRLAKPCCVAPDECNMPMRFDLLGTLLAENGVSSTWERAQLDSTRFWDELFERRPVLLADVFDGGADGHVRVAFGWHPLPRGARLVRIADPAEGKIASTTLEELQRSRWRETWHRIEVIHGES